MPLGLDTVAQLRTRTSMPFDVHLMASENDYFVRELLDIGVEQLVFHAETERHIDNRLNQIHAAGARAGIALKPATPLSVLDYVLEKCDAVLLMLINPGYAQCRTEGQVPYAARKIRELREMISAGATQVQLTEAARRNQGMTSLREAALQLVRDGETTPEELLKITFYEE